MRYVLGGGLAGLIWGFYHSDYKIITDKLAWAVKGVVPKIVLYDNPETVRWVTDVLGDPPQSYPLKIGYVLDDGRIHPEADLSDMNLRTIMEKKMRPWREIRKTGFVPATPAATMGYQVADVKRVGARNQPVIDTDAASLVAEMLRVVQDRGQISIGERVTNIDYEQVWAGSCGFKYEHVVSTIPAPIFQRVWDGDPLGWHLESIPLTMVMSERRPSWFEDEWQFIYDARTTSPVSRVTRLGEDYQYEITGYLSSMDWNLIELSPKEVFPYPYGRIVGGGVVSPHEKITFLGRFAQC